MKSGFIGAFVDYNRMQHLLWTQKATNDTSATRLLLPYPNKIPEIIRILYVLD